MSARSLNPAIDIGQIEGGFVQGMGWLTTEELVFDTRGRLLTHAPSTYKIPVACDVPADFRVALFPTTPIREDTIYRSKAVGEPPIMLANSVFCAIADAIHAIDPSQAGASRCAGDARGDPARLRGLARTPDAATERRVKTWRQLAEFLAVHRAAALIGVHDVKGSAPREPGARMVVRPDGAFHGTIGGGQLEMKMLSIAGDMLGSGVPEARLVDQALGPDLGQCCGGRVKILIETFDPQHLAQVRRFAAIEEKGVFVLECRLEDGFVQRETASSVGDDRWTQWRETYGENRTPVLLFGAGHVGRALVLALAPLPFTVRWFDSRPDAFPAHIPQNSTAILLNDVRGGDRRGGPRCFRAGDDSRPSAGSGHHRRGTFSRLSLCGADRQLLQTGAVRKAFSRDWPCGGSHRRARLPHRSCGHRRQGPSHHRRLRDGAIAATSRKGRFKPLASDPSWR